MKVMANSSRSSWKVIAPCQFLCFLNCSYLKWCGILSSFSALHPESFRDTEITSYYDPGIPLKLTWLGGLGSKHGKLAEGVLAVH